MVLGGVVLAGGSGRRMGGVDKAGLLLGGVTLLDRVLAAARPLCDALVVVGPARPTAVTGVAFVTENALGGGPVPAVLTGVAALPGCDTVLVLATDLPLLTTADLQALLAALDDTVDATASSEASGPNPLLAAYRSMALVARAAHLDLGAGSPASHLLPSNPVLVDLGAAAYNVNRREDLAVAEALLGDDR